MRRKCRERFPRHRLQREPLASDPSRYASGHVCHAHAVVHVGIANPRRRGKRSQHLTGLIEAASLFSTFIVKFIKKLIGLSSTIMALMSKVLISCSRRCHSPQGYENKVWIATYTFVHLFLIVITNDMGPILLTRVNSTWVRNYIHCKKGNEITSPFPNVKRNLLVSIHLCKW